jgi:hypothetical protein
MRWTGFAVITFLVVGCCAAFGQSYTFGFENYNGTTLYCNYETFTLYNDGYLVAGVDNLQACGDPRNAVLIGAKTSVPKNAGLGQTGLAYGMADNLYDAIYGFDTQEQWFLISETKAGSGKHPKQGWIGLAGYNGYIVGDNAGILTTNIPGDDRASAGYSLGKATVASGKTGSKK